MSPQPAGSNSQTAWRLTGGWNVTATSSTTTITVTSTTSDNSQQNHDNHCQRTGPNMTLRLDASSCVQSFGDYQDRNTPTCALLFRIDNPKDPHGVEVDQAIEGVGSSEANWAQFCQALPEDDCRYGIFNVSWEAEDGHRVSGKSVFVLWAPEGSPVKSKLVYSAASGSLKMALQTGGVNFRAGDRSELEFSLLLDKAKSATTSR